PRLVKAFTVFLRLGEDSRFFGTAGVALPAEIALGVAVAGLEEAIGTPADPLADLRLVAARHKQRQQPLALVDTLADHHFQLARRPLRPKKRDLPARQNMR